MTLKSQLSNWLHSEELDEAKLINSNQLAEAKRINSALMDYAQYKLTPAGLLENIGELDSQLIDLLLDISRYEQIGGMARGVNEEDRKRAVELSRWYERTDVLISLAVDMWTDFGFGQAVHIVPNDPKAVDVWDECWTAPRNRFLFAQDAIHEQFSRRILVDGERFFVTYVSMQDGAATWRVFDTDQITQIITAPNDPVVKLWYIVETGTGKMAFPDAFAVFSFADHLKKFTPPDDVQDVNAIPQALENGGTFAAIVPAQRNLDRNGRGWPQFNNAFPWAKETGENIENHAAVSRLVATYVDKITGKGGQRALDMIKDSLQSSMATNDSYYDTNPAPAAGSTWLQNEQVDRQRMPLTTGARDAQTDSMVLLSMFAAGVKVPPHWLMRPDMLQNRAVAEELAKPAVESWRRYQTFWAARFADIVETTLRFKDKFDKGVSITDFSALIQMDSPLDLESLDLTRAMDSITNAGNAGTLPMDAAQKVNTVIAQLLLGDFGINNPTSVVEPPDETTAERLREQLDDDTDPPMRDELEDELQTAVQKTFDDFRANAEQALENGEQPDYDELQAALVAALVVVLTQAALSRADEVQDEFQMFVDETELEAAIADWAQEEAESMAAGMVDTTRNIYDRAAEAPSSEQAQQLIDQATNENRSDLVAITGITIALSAGLFLLNGIYRSQHNVEMVEVWFTQDDERVCPICGPLHGTTPRTWRARFPGGPPAHPRCRCFTHVLRLRSVL